MRDLLRLVVVSGSGTHANVDGYLVGGKTGTANKVNPNGRYAEDKVVSTFVGAFPMNKPQYIVMILLDDPKPTADTKGFKTAGWVSAPFVGDVIKRIAPILKVVPQPDDSEAIKAKFNITAGED
jgi:cell division protein FtsI (penicillin-binding protein 3)